MTLELYTCKNYSLSSLISAENSTQCRATKKEKLPLLISGAGIAGLSLANALDNINEELDPSQQIPYVIIERDEKSDTRNQGYGLTLLPETLNYIKHPKVLPNLSNRIIKLIGGYESRNHKDELLSLDLKDEDAKLKNVIARSELRSGLLDKVGKEKVRWATTVTGFEQTKDGMLVHLKSKEEKTTLLVANLIATDGVNSKIREILVKDSKHYLGIVGVYGRLPNDKAVDHLNHEFQVDDNKGFRLFSKPYNVENYNWQMFFPWEEKKPLLDNKQMLNHIVEELSANSWDSKYVEFVKQTDPDTMRCGLMYDRNPIIQLKDAGAVTLIGDSAHPVSPYKGRGANLAIQGVQIFTQVAKQAIINAAKSETDIDWAAVNRLYEAKHWPLASQIQTSCRKSVLEHHFSSNGN